MIHIAWNAKGLALDDLGKHDEAIKATTKQLKLTRRTSNAWIGKGIALKLGKYDEAIKANEKAIEINPQDFKCLDR